MPSFFDLQKFAATGIASADMTAYDKARALAAFGAKTRTLTDVPPLPFKADGKPLISLSMLGNGEQQGTPSPQSIIMPTFCGVRTANLFDVSTVEKGRIDNGVVGYVSQTSSLTIEGESVSFTTTATYRGVCSGFFEIPEGTETISFNFTSNEELGVKFVFYDDTKTWLNQDYTPTLSDIPPATANVPSGAKYVRLSFTGQIVGGYSYVMSNIMLNSGTTALPYEPYGWAEKITCAGQTSTVYLGQTQTVRRVRKLVLTGEEDWTSTTTSYGICFGLVSGTVFRINSSFCTHFKNSGYTGNSRSTARSSLSDDEFICVRSFDQMYFRKDSSSDKESFKTYLQQQYAAGTPVTVWYVLAEPSTGIVNEPLCKIGDYADELSSEDAGVSIPTVKGQNVLTVDTELQPSSMTITYFEEV